jgi:hypothetical protein
MKIVLINIFLFYFSVYLALAQGSIQYTDNQIKSNKSDTAFTPKKLDYSFSTGFSYSTGAFKGSLYYVAPNINYQFSQKFSLHSSIAFLRSNIYPTNANLNFGEQGRLFDNRQSSAIFSASGDYLVNNRILISGSVIKSFNLSGQSNIDSRMMNNNFQILSLGLQYKISPSVTLGTDFRVIQGNLYNPAIYGMGYNNFGGGSFNGF